MSKKYTISYTRSDRKAEKEMDNFLRRINGGSQLNIMDELKALSL